jgi:hypothetical protein
MQNRKFATHGVCLCIFSLRISKFAKISFAKNYLFHLGLLPEFHYQGNEITRFQQQSKEKNNAASSAKSKHRTKPKVDDKEACTGRDRHPGPPYLHQLHPDQDLLQSTTGAPPTERAHKHQKNKRVLNFQLQQTYTCNPTNKHFSTQSNAGAACLRPPKLLLLQHRSSPRLVAIWALRMMLKIT